jgi:TetR/AcrR family transcriptional regulator
MDDLTVGSRERILEAARAEFARYGYAGARVARIARHAQVNKQLLYYYFGSKLNLHRTASSLPEASWPAVPVSGGAPERLRQAIDRLFGALQDHPELVALLLDRQGSDDAELAARRFVAHAFEDLAGVISEGQGMGYFGDRVDPAEAAGKGVVLCAGYLALEPCLPPAARSRGTWSTEVSALLLRTLEW